MPDPKQITTIAELKAFVQQETLAMSQETLARLTGFENRVTDALNTIEEQQAGGLTTEEANTLAGLSEGNATHAETIAGGGAPPAPAPLSSRRR